MPEDTDIKEKDPNDVWLERAQQADYMSTSFMDNNYRKEWEDCIRHFQSRHHAASKYNKASYLYRSKHFRPKTRSMVRNFEAMAAAAYFANMDAVSIEPNDSDNFIQVASADVNRALVNYRLQETIPWFMTCIGAFQEAVKIGVICSYQCWRYKEQTRKYEKRVWDMDTDEDVSISDIEETRTIADHPEIKLLPPENVRIHPFADWTNPIKSSPFLIIYWPMYVIDVKERMSGKTPADRRWKTLTDGEIKSGTKLVYDSTRMTREGNREDATEKEHTKKLGDYDVVWVHENFFRTPSGDVVFYTLGTEHMLSDPAPMEEIPEYLDDERPVVMGIASIETFKTYPQGPVGFSKPMQVEVNEINNQRRDNVLLVLNKRYFARRGSQVDLKSLVRNVAGSVTMMNNVDSDVKPIDFHDVTGSSYMEQDRLNADYDSLTGTFDSGSLTTNRRMNETVGGMKMLRAGTMTLSEYLIKTFSETWVEPVIKQLIKLEQKNETDLTILSIAQNKAQLYQKYGIDTVTDQLLNQKLTITVNAGMGATDPVVRVERFLLAIDKYSQVIERQAKLQTPIFNNEEVGKEIFGRLGYKDGKRFMFQTQAQQNEQLMMMVQQLQAAVQQLQTELQSKDADRQLKLIETKMKEEGQDRRKQAELQTRLTEKAMDLENPVPGEKVA